jgi:hypothetical protein
VIVVLPDGPPLGGLTTVLMIGGVVNESGLPYTGFPDPSRARSWKAYVVFGDSVPNGSVAVTFVVCDV